MIVAIKHLKKQLVALVIFGHLLADSFWTMKISFIRNL